jgi:hypothetical protein
MYFLLIAKFHEMAHVTRVDFSCMQPIMQPSLGH